MDSRFIYLRDNLNRMAEFTLEQIFMLSDALENDTFDLAGEIIIRDNIIDSMEKDNDQASQNAILEIAATTTTPAENESLKDAIRLALAAIRITRYLERIGDHAVSSSRILLNGNIRPGIFKSDQNLSLILARVTTIVGMTVESLIEEKNRFFGSVQTVENELDEHCSNFLHSSLEESNLSRREFADIFRIILSLERIGDLAYDIAMELVRLQTGKDIRHQEPLSLAELNTPGLS